MVGWPYKLANKRPKPIPAAFCRQLVKHPLTPSRTNWKLRQDIVPMTIIHDDVLRCIKASTTSGPYGLTNKNAEAHRYWEAGYLAYIFNLSLRTFEMEIKKREKCQCRNRRSFWRPITLYYHYSTDLHKTPPLDLVLTFYNTIGRPFIDNAAPIQRHAMEKPPDRAQCCVDNSQWMSFQNNRRTIAPGDQTTASYSTIFGQVREM